MARVNKNMMRQMQQMQNKLEKAKEELETMTVTGTAGGGVIKITMNGHQMVTQVDISPDVVDENDIETLQDVVLAAINDACDKSQQLASKHLGNITGGLGIPGL
tara:strand:- start:4341 stop:4652 length:312 start_codon:yes stop_codon:yes gene_type:complete